jgi:hypothetical protein
MIGSFMGVGTTERVVDEIVRQAGAGLVGCCLFSSLATNLAGGGPIPHRVRIFVRATPQIKPS